MNDERTSRVRDILSNRKFLFFWISNSLADIGDSLHLVALGYWIMISSSNVLDLSMLMVAKAVPNIIFAPLAGTLADRINKVKIIRATSILQSLIVLLIIYFVFNDPSGESVYIIIGLTALIGLFGAFSNPSRQSLLVRLVEKKDIPSATAFHRLSTNIIMVSAPMITGVLVAATSSAVTLFIDVILLLLSALAISFIKVEMPQNNISKKLDGFWFEFKEGIRFIYKTPPLNSLIILNNTLNIFGVAQGILMSAVAINIWKVSSVGYGLVQAAFPIGMVLGAAIMIKLPNLKMRGKWICIFYAIAGVFSVVVPFFDNLLIAIPLLAIDGAFTVMGALLVNILFRVYIDPDMQGRAFGIYGSLAAVASPLGALTGGIIADTTGVFEGIIGISIAFSIVPIIAYLFSPKIRSIN
ncbi:MFS transporter [Sutcliffiella rhizosphaerae]|uniref:Enterobactin exporter EntS n=1 Tax=Sutcliffiella rhizosphaerae TaxID=2880967 RepID=A0ABN8AIP0_9BACI|nr:MFS transporter [Sutcliffiella rhizosphaerae]CAG9623407.1 Enterobactin exporter EntS [Sutcliffiella rhizosphaerae]